MLQFISASKEINEHAAEYWPLVMDIARRNNVKRIMRCGQIMGRSDTEEMSAAQIFYPCMQCADIFFLKVRCCNDTSQQCEHCGVRPLSLSSRESPAAETRTAV